MPEELDTRDQELETRLEQGEAERQHITNLLQQKHGETLYLKAELYDKLCQIDALRNQVHELQHVLEHHHH